uniref:Tyrosine-protein phosphatase domain-containing protein n=1 Tax=Caenorhabditis tropicalis TaxID=1561998 RepID=A0A1I7SXG9_9PELO
MMSDNRVRARFESTIEQDKSNYMRNVSTILKEGVLVYVMMQIILNDINFLKLKLILRKLTVMYLNHSHTEDLYNTAAELAHVYDVADGLWNNVCNFIKNIYNSTFKAQLRRKVLAKLGMTSSNVFPPDFNWSSIPNVKCLYDNTGNFNRDKNVTLIWMADGAEKYVKEATIINVDGKFSSLKL